MSHSFHYIFCLVSQGRMGCQYLEKKSKCARRQPKKRNLHELPYTEIINPGESDSPLVNNWNDEVKTIYVYTWVPGGVAHVHERGEGLGGVGHSHAHIHPAQASALRQRVF